VVRTLLIDPIVMSSSNTCTMIRRALMAALVVAVVLPATWVLGPNQGDMLSSSEAAPASAAAKIAKASPRAETTGQIMAPDAIPVIAPVGGAIVVVSVDEGTAVKAGEVLAVLAHDDTKLLAPVDGVVSRRTVNRGSVVRPEGAAPFFITPTAPLRLVVEVDAATSRSLRSSSTAIFTTGTTGTGTTGTGTGTAGTTDKDRSFKARFSAVRAEPNGSGSLRYFASFSTEGSGAKVSPGMKVAVQVNK
jgi:multidrug efflux pump subunit AcrA (membrane-fusion protein)